MTPEQRAFLNHLLETKGFEYARSIDLRACKACQESQGHMGAGCHANCSAYESGCDEFLVELDKEMGSCPPS